MNSGEVSIKHENRLAPSPLSLVIPVRDEALTIDCLLESIGTQTRPPDEIVFVDGGSHDDTVQKLVAASHRNSKIRVLEAGDATPGRGRNVGISAARHDWVALTDAGICLDPRWLEGLAKAIQRDPAVKVVYGNFEPLMRNFFERCASLAYVPPKTESPSGPIRGPSIASCLIHREVWRAVGGFPDLRASEDLIFMERIREMGFKAAYASEATAWWELQPSLAKTFRKFALYSKHNALAGRARYWHYGVARMYVAGLPFLVLAIASSPLWLLLPVLGSVLRVAKSIWDRRKGYNLVSLLNPFQFAGVGLVLATIDLATFLGWAQAQWQRAGFSRNLASAGKPEGVGPSKDGK